MKALLRGKPGGAAAFLIIAGLVAGGLGWVTAAALRLEQEQLQQRALSEEASQVRLALWRLDGLVAPHLSGENGRPFNHYSAIFVPPLAFKSGVVGCWPAGAVMEPTPLLGAELPPWIALHFQASAASGWASPEVPADELARRLRYQGQTLPSQNVTDSRRALLGGLKHDVNLTTMVAAVRERARSAARHDTALVMVPRRVSQASQTEAQTAQAQELVQNVYEYQTRSHYQSKAVNDQKSPQRIDWNVARNNTQANGANWLDMNNDQVRSKEVDVTMTRMVPYWVTSKEGDERLLLVRLVKIENEEVCQGIALDVATLKAELIPEVTDLFPAADLTPMREVQPPEPERTMAALPLVLETGPRAPVPPPAWTPLRVGLALSWAAALVALAAVALGGLSLINLSERRIGFVSAVTHELRTPLTTLRLYLDLLQGGVIRDESQRAEYIRTLHGETDRLNRLVSNVLDFSRLERQRPQLNLAMVSVDEVFAHLKSAWEPRCQETEKELVFENLMGSAATLRTDGALLLQVLGNLIDNACKYSRGAEDRRLWARAKTEGNQVVFEVEDRGPGVPAPERRLIFRAFRRGNSADVTAGGVGLGLALAQRWTGLLRGRLSLVTPADGGACFRVALPATSASIQAQ